MVPAPPGPPIGRVDGVRLALAGTDLVAFEDHPVLERAHLDPFSFEGPANGDVTPLRVGTVVPIPGHERCAARAGESRKPTTRVAAQDDETRSPLLELPREVVQARIEEPEPGMRLAMPPEEGVVENEHRNEHARPRAGRRERGVVFEAEITSEPVNDPHYGICT